MKIRPVGAELLRTDKQTDITKPIVAFRKFCERAYKMKVQICLNVLHMLCLLLW